MKFTANNPASSAMAELAVSHPSDQDPQRLRVLIEEMRNALNRVCDDRVLNETVNALFTEQSVDETIEQLKYLNGGGKPQWAF